jgi:hypothetical protein
MEKDKKQVICKLLRNISSIIEPSSNISIQLTLIIKKLSQNQPFSNLEDETFNQIHKMSSSFLDRDYIKQNEAFREGVIIMFETLPEVLKEINESTRTRMTILMA